MFGKRADGRRLKNISPIFLLMPHIMKRRSDSQVFYSQEIPIAPLDEYIAKKEAEGIRMSYMSIIYASLYESINLVRRTVRTIKEKAFEIMNIK